MEHTILWSGLENVSLEHCSLKQSASGVFIQSTIIGLYGSEICQVEYAIRTNTHWITKGVKIQLRRNEKTEAFHIKSIGVGRWLFNGKEMRDFDGCIDIDIPLTPMTNSLPINRLRLQPGETKEINVVYMDVLANSVRPVRQRYTRTSASVHHYENIPNDFEADIETDPYGIVIHYPGLFSHKAMHSLPDT